MSVPKLRFKEFDGDWEVNTIQHFLDNNFILDQMDGNHGELYPKSEEFSSAGVPYVSATDFSSGTVDFSQCKRLPLERAALFKKGIAKNGDVLFAHNATVGPVAILETELDFVILSTTATYYRCDGNFLNNYYLKNYFESDFFVQQYFGIMSQSTRNQVPITTQRKLSISIPIIKEQTKIASFLSAVDEKISQLTQKHELLSQYKQGMMQKLFSQQIRFKADDGSEFGEWKKVKFSDKFKFHQTNSYSRALLSEQGEIMNIHYGDIHTKFSTLFDISKEVVPFLSSEVNTNKFAEDQFLQVGDLVIADASEDYKDIGKALEIIHLNNQKVVAGLHTYIARPVQPFALGFCGYLMQTFEVREQIKKLATGISVLGISKTNIGKVEIKVPCLEEQTKIANFLSAIDQKIEVVAQQIEQAKQWKKGLLQQMFV
ncbi:restriction endonuclease subunit S [Acinetobacter baumannii]|uniref:restriction endonuclease subunit S n=1 Tax=Acinetobacter baumannii TaxID=470 RepID=UPI002B0CA189|nr:restriction endonuclease subunit S [Acinetobacter baumannii]